MNVCLVRQTADYLPTRRARCFGNSLLLLQNFILTALSIRT